MQLIILQDSPAFALLATTHEDAARPWLHFLCSLISLRSFIELLSSVVLCQPRRGRRLRALL